MIRYLISKEALLAKCAACLSKTKTVLSESDTGKAQRTHFCFISLANTPEIENRKKIFSEIILKNKKRLAFWKKRVYSVLRLRGQGRSTKVIVGMPLFYSRPQDVQPTDAADADLRGSA